MNHVALRSDSLNFISLCSGGGGLDFGVELAIPNARPVVLVEGEAWSVATLVQAMEARLMAPAPVWSNVRTFDGRPWRGLVDGLIGGIPCQPHSLAGKRGGQEDERDLWSPTRRIIVQSGAWFVLIENVRGMLSAKPGQVAGAHRVWRDLRRLGFEVEVGLFTAAEIGASHERERVFILAVADDANRGRCSWQPPHGCEGSQGSAGRRGVDVANTCSDGRCERGEQDSRAHEPGQQACGRRDTDGRHQALGHSDSAGLEGRRHQPDGRARERAIGANGGELVDAGGERRAARRQTYGSDERHQPDTTSGLGMVDAIGCRHDGIEENKIGRSIERDAAERTSRSGFGDVADADIIELRRQSSAGKFPQLQQDDGLGLYPPRPSDIDGWRRVLAHSPHLEPAVRRMVDGVAARLDLSGPHAARIERLRMLGNGVVPLEAAYALRTLATRLARRSAGAERLVRMMVS